MLTDVIKKSTTRRWGPQEQLAFDELKGKVANAKCFACLGHKKKLSWSLTPAMWAGVERRSSGKQQTRRSSTRQFSNRGRMD